MRLQERLREPLSCEPPCCFLLWLSAALAASSNTCFRPFPVKADASRYWKIITRNKLRIAIKRRKTKLTQDAFALRANLEPRLDLTQLVE